MTTNGPEIERLTRRLAECPGEFLAAPDVIAVVCDHMRRMTPDAPPDRSPALAVFSNLFEAVSVDATAFLMSAWRGEVNLLDLSKPEYRPFVETRRSAAAAAAQRGSDALERTIATLASTDARKAG